MIWPGAQRRRDAEARRVAVIQYIDGEDLGVSGTAGPPAGATPPASTPPAQAEDPSPPFGETIRLGCPSPDTGTKLKLTLRVRFFCVQETVRDQVEFKLKVWVRNRGAERLDITRPRLRLLLTRFKRSRWSPPRHGPPTHERPFRTSWRGRRVWAVPANADGAADRIPERSGRATFATFWGGQQLEPREEYRPTGRYEGNLVFMVPKDDGGSDTLSAVVGLAYVSADREVIAVCPPRRWEERRSSGAF